MPAPGGTAPKIPSSGRIGYAVNKKSPNVVLAVAFRMFPLAWGFLLSFRTGDGAGGSTFVGLDNYRALTTYQAFLDSLVNTLVLLATLPIWVMLPLLLAILIHQGVPGGKMFRAVYFFPAAPVQRPRCPRL